MPSPPSQLSVAVEGLGARLTWSSGFTFPGEEVTYVITSEEMSSGLQTEERTNLTSMQFTPLSGNMCRNYTFTVLSENAVGQSISGVSQSILLPAGQCTLLEIHR